MKKIDVIVVGRVLDSSKKLLGYKIYDLSSLSPAFIKLNDLVHLIHRYNFVNCIYCNDALRSKWRNIRLKDMSIYNKYEKIVKCGLYTDSQLIAYAFKVPSDSIVFRICGALVSGAITDILGVKAQAHAELYYNEIRTMKTDIDKISINTGIPREKIARIKNYLFMDYHNLGGKYERFVPDFAIAQTWQGLMSNNGKDIKPHDLTLLKHELLEMDFIDNKGMSQSEAHNLVEKVYNYQKESEDYYDSIKRNKKNR